MNELLRNGCMILGLSSLPACQSSGPVSELNLSSSSKPVVLIANIGKAMQKCWFKAGNSAFLKYRIANESNSHTGRPRLLLVPKNKPTGLPSLVVQAQVGAGQTKLQAYGPLLSSANGASITNDISNWAIGGSTCGTWGKK